MNIASVTEWTDSRQWGKFPSQKSVAIPLQANQSYYVEALQKEGDGGDNLAVGWAKPGQATSAPSEVIPGSVLSPFTGGPAGGPTLSTLSPNSAAAGGPDFTLTVNGSNFVSGSSVVLWKGAPRTTTFVNASQLTAAIPAADIAAAGSALVTVQNPGGAVSNALAFAITGPPGAISREVWTGIGGNSVSNIPVGTTPPNTTDTLPSFEAPAGWADNYGTRLRGYIKAPVTGNYIFWIASDDNSELWLSTTNDNPVNKVNIASVTEWTDSRQWGKFPSQKSVAIPLQANQSYYVEALQKEGDGGDNLAVGWAKPGQATSAPSEVIPGSVLSPFTGGPAGGPTLSTLSPNSAAAGGPDFTLTVNGSNFVSGSSVVLWKGAPRTTTFVNASQLTAAIPAADIAAAGSALVTVQNSGGAVSNALAFAITGPPGAISREVWTGIGGNSVSNIPVGTTPPNTTDTLPSFEAPTNWAENYGTRLRGYIKAPVTGNYIFWIASDDNSQLWLSTTNDDPVNKVNIASVTEWTDSRQWGKFPSQKSVAIPLQANQSYYVEALQKEGDGGDNLAVGWAKPGQATSAPSEVIPGSVLSPFTGGPAGGPTLSTLSPNSAAAGGPDFTLTVNGSNFVSGSSVVLWKGAPRTTTFVNASQLTAAIPAADIAAAGSALVTVQNPGGAVSNALAFAITGPPGAISREVWTGIGGNSVSDIPVGTGPNTTDTLPSFEAPTNWAENYGTRLRGYIKAPVTGNYIFWIASDDNSQLWLSTTNDDPVNKVNIASVTEWTDSRQWNKFPSQKSVAIPLQANQSYYVEALQKEGGGGDNLAVGWAKPGQAISAPSEVIPGSVLSPFSGGSP